MVAAADVGLSRHDGSGEIGAGHPQRKSCSDPSCRRLALSWHLPTARRCPIKLYTVQPLPVYDLLCQEGMFHSRPLAHADSTLVFFNDSFIFALAYDWMIGSMIARGLSRPHPEVYPIWAFYRWYGTTMPKPDLRCVDMKHWGHRQRQALLTLEIPDEGVLLSDYGRWHVCLNYQYAGTVKAGEAFERRCNRHHPKPSYSGPLPAPLHQELVASWDLVLDIEASRRMSRTPTATHSIQATFWEMTAQQVVAAVAFGGGRPLARLPLPGRRTRSTGHPAKGGMATGGVAALDPPLSPPLAPHSRLLLEPAPGAVPPAGWLAPSPPLEDRGTAASCAVAGYRPR